VAIVSEALLNLDAEAYILGSLMTNPLSLEDIADILKADDFADPVHADIFEIVTREIGAGRSPSPVAIKGHFTDHAGLARLGGLGYLARLTSDVGLHPVADMARIVADLARRRSIRDGLASASKACADMRVDVAEIVSGVDLIISERSEQQLHQPDALEAIDEMIAGIENGACGVTSGCIPSLDGVMGDLRPTDFTIMAGRPGMGKTAVAVSYANGVAQQGYGVLFFSFEVGADQLGGRICSDLCFDLGGTYYSKIRSGELDQLDRKRIGQAREVARKMPLRLVCTGTMTPSRMRSLVRQHKRRMASRGVELRLIVIDYLQLMTPDKSTGGRTSDVDSISRGLKQICMDEGVSILALAQLSRAVEARPDKRPNLSDLRESGQMEQDANNVIFLLRMEYYLRKQQADLTGAELIEWQQAMEKYEGKVEFISDKRRNGETGSAFGDFHGAFQAVRG
jgi:replicative DNA helicase